jgi:hypothetical protein
MMFSMGAHIRGDAAMPRNTPALATLMLVVGTWKLEATSGAAARMEELAKFMGKTIQQTENSTMRRRHLDSGMRGSSSLLLGDWCSGGDASNEDVEGLSEVTAFMSASILGKYRKRKSEPFMSYSIFSVTSALFAILIQG